MLTHAILILGLAASEPTNLDFERTVRLDQRLIDAQALIAEGRHAAAMTLIEAAARDGEPRAQAAMAYAYLSGEGLPADAKLAWIWMRLAARSGHHDWDKLAAAIYQEIPLDERRHARRRLEEMAAMVPIDWAVVCQDVHDGEPEAVDACLARRDTSRYGADVPFSHKVPPYRHNVPRNTPPGR